jgi:hypothetical protein
MKTAILIMLLCVVGGTGLDLMTGPGRINLNGDIRIVERYIRSLHVRQWCEFVFGMSCIVALVLIEVLP